MIRDMRRGHVPSVERLRSLCEVLDLEFYVGQRRVRWDEREDAPSNLMYTLERLAQDLAQLTADAGGNPVSDDLLSQLVAKQVAGSLQLKRELMEAHAVMMNKDLGGVTERWREGQPLDALMARSWRDSLMFHAQGLETASCELIEIRDEYMEPTLPNGCTVLVDHESTDWQPSRIMAVRIDNDVIARRAAVGDDGQPLLESDHPDWPIAPLPASAEVVGEIRWASIWLDRDASAGERVEGIPALTLAQD